MAAGKKSEDELKREVARLKEQIEKLNQKAREKGHNFTSLDEAALLRKLRGETSNSPFILQQSWKSIGSPGSAADYHVWVHNPDPVSYEAAYLTIFFGLGNILSMGDAWVGRDKRWPEFSSDRSDLAAGAELVFSFDYTVPAVPVGTYNGNSVLWHGEWHDVGKMFDRGSFDIKIS